METDVKKRLLEEALALPVQPGVYLMKDPSGHILYIGKAKSLKNRVCNYFRSAPQASPRIDMLVARIEAFDIILTETESEALILECTLIKKHKPRFNVMLKDDKSFPYIRVDFNHSHPRLEWIRRPKRVEGVSYFGPFPSAWSARQVLNLLNETFLLRDCSENTFRHRSRPCILYQMGKCSGPCVGKISQPDYMDSVERAVSVLRGQGDDLILNLRKQMGEASESQDYERAAEFRDQLGNIELVTQTQGVESGGSEANWDVVGVASLEGAAHGVLMEMRRGKIIGIRHYQLQNSHADMTRGELSRDFIAQYYARAEGLEAVPMDLRPSVVLVSEPPTEWEDLEAAFGFSVRVPENEQEHRMTRVAESNARHTLESEKKRTVSHGARALEEAQYKLQLERPPQRIECYDISNIQGGDAVASRVVFIDGAPMKDLYRRYKIRTVEGANDFAMMREVLDRRFSNSEEALPDLVVVDGGRGQLSQATSILEELNIQGVAVVGLAKARTERDFQKQEVTASSERIFIPNRKNPVKLREGSPCFRLLTHVRDEAHRFAVAYHRIVRKKRTLTGQDGKQ